MKIVKPSAEVFFHYPYSNKKDKINLQKFLERIGRICYKSENLITEDSASKFITMLKERGHHAMLEHCVATVIFITDVGVTHEEVRHRLSSFAQESTRYCNYTKGKFDNQISAIKPPFKNKTGKAQDIWEELLKHCESAYRELLELGESPQIARSVLPKSLKTEIAHTANLREWMHIFNLRCSPQAHPQIKEIMLIALKEFVEEVPELFRDIWDKYKDQPNG